MLSIRHANEHDFFSKKNHKKLTNTFAFDSNTCIFAPLKKEENKYIIG